MFTIRYSPQRPSLPAHCSPLNRISITGTDALLARSTGLDCRYREAAITAGNLACDSSPAGSPAT